MLERYFALISTSFLAPIFMSLLSVGFAQLVQSGPITGYGRPCVIRLTRERRLPTTHSEPAKPARSLYFSCMGGLVWKTAWKAVTISGGALTLLGYSFNSLAYSTRFHLPLSWLGANMICVLVGIACLSVGQVGWILLLDKAGRARITAFGFGFPIALGLIGIFSTHGDSHGSFPIFFLPLYPLILVAFILVWLW